MQPEIEATFIEINKEQIRAQLKSLGAKLVIPETLMKRTIFDTGPHSFARVRDEGICITMSYKSIDSLTLSGTTEICLEVDNYDNAVALLQSCGLKPKASQEAYREEWKLDGVKFDIDTWPWLPTYLEIEGPSEAAVQAAATKLGLSMAEAHYGSADGIYQIYYDVTTSEINTCPEIKFTDIPAWLAAKRRATPLKTEV